MRFNINKFIKLNNTCNNFFSHNKNERVSDGFHGVGKALSLVFAMECSNFYQLRTSELEHVEDIC